MAKTRLRSNFRAVKGAAHDAIQHAVDEALIEGQQEAQRRIQRIDDSRGYDLNPFEVHRKDFPVGEGGMIFVPSSKWYYRFFEYGTTYIPAGPFMRPAHRRMRKVFKEKMGDDFEKFIRRRTRSLR